jgi:hypothetical protein
MATKNPATKADRIVVRLESEMRAKLHERASTLGLDDAAHVRMSIYANAKAVWRGCRL